MGRPCGTTASREDEDGHDRLLARAAACLRDEGITRFSLQRASAHAGVSKALLLYHFANRDALLAALTGWLTNQVAARERAALQRSTGPGVLDDLWDYLVAEDACGEYCALLTLVGAHVPVLDDALAQSVARRRSHAECTIEAICQRLQLTPRLPLVHLTEAEQAFREGLLLRMAHEIVANPRAAFDVFWLSLLNQSA